MKMKYKRPKSKEELKRLRDLLLVVAAIEVLVVFLMIAMYIFSLPVGCGC